ncbi:GldG family protein [bacterium]|nr:GldG family protein [candidate division CSSED10-310 bacterium]
MAQQLIKRGSQSFLLILIVTGILFFANILSARFFFRADLTENKEYTITDSTKNILSGLDDIVNVRLYFSKELPPYIANLEKQVRDILDEFRAYSGNRLHVEFIDPADDPELKSKLQRMGIPELQLTVIEKDQRQVRKAYLGMSIQFGDKNEVIPMIRNLDNLEYDLASALLKVSSTKQQILGWVGPRETDESPGGYSEFQKILNEEYMVRNLDPAALSTIPNNIEALVVPGNQMFPDRTLYAIDQYLMQNGNVIFLSDAVELNRETFSATVSRQSVAPMLEHYGIRIEPEMVLDRSNAYAAFNSGFMRFRLPYPFWPKIREEYFNDDNPAVNQLESLVLPWVSPIENLTGDNRSFTPLMTTTEYSWTAVEPFDLNPQQRFDVEQSETGKHVVGAIVQGRFTSYFKDRPVPEKPQKSDRSEEEESPEKPIEESGDISFILISNTRFINNQFSQIFPENAIFMQNIIDSLTIGDKLIGIRSRQVTSRSLDYGTTDEKRKESIKSTHRFLGTFAVPILVIVFGLSRFWVRKNRKLKMRDQSGE